MESTELNLRNKMIWPGKKKEEKKSKNKYILITKYMNHTKPKSEQFYL